MPGGADANVNGFGMGSGGWKSGRGSDDGRVEYGTCGGKFERICALDEPAPCEYDARPGTSAPGRLLTSVMTADSEAKLVTAPLADASSAGSRA